jgi:hypothetical protein
MLHEPQLELVKCDEWHAWLESCVSAGKIGSFGLASVAQRIEPFLETAPGMAPVIQVFDSLDQREADVVLRHDRSLQITYGYVSAARTRGTTMSVMEILARSLNRNADGAIIVSTQHKERLSQYSTLTRSRH